MFHNLPDQDAWRQVASYTDIFMITLLWNLFIYGAWVFAIYIIVLILKLYHLHQKKRQILSRESLLTYQSRTSHNNDQGTTPSMQTQQQQKEEDQALPLNRRKQPVFTYYNVVNFITSLTFYLTLILIAFVYLVFYMFGFMGSSTGHDILAVLVMLVIVALPTVLWKYKTRSQLTKIAKKQIILTVVMLLMWMIVSIIAVIMLKGVCICVFNENYGYKIKDQFIFSTQWSRKQQIQKVCPENEICHLYATLAEDSAHSVLINVHSGTNITNLTITLTTGASTFTQNITNPLSLTNLESVLQRNVHHAYFDKLTPDSLYNITITNTDDGSLLTKSAYKTLPDENAEEIRMAVGGDVGLDQMAKNLTSFLVDFDPHVLIIGGDIAYDDGMKTCFYSWDNFYQIFEEQLNDKLGRLVPIVMSVGNHDVGFDALATVSLDFDDVDQIPNFFLLNPQHLTSNGSIPQPKQRNTYHYHIIGPTIHVHLDSGYIQTFKSQRYLIQFLAKQYPNHYKFANYHNPLYPSCTDSTPGSNDVKVIEQGTREWTPLFQSNNYTVAFEHHTHHRKFTHRIKNGTVTPDKSGVRYIGDGSWGVPEGGCGAKRTTKHPEWFEHYETDGSPNHIWKIKVIKTTDNTHSIEYVAINDNNTQVYKTHDDL